MQDPYDVVKTVRVTEKGTALAAKRNTYVLKVDKRASKIDVRRAVETIFKVKVLGVNTLNVHGKLARDRRSGRYLQAPSWKKAFVTLKAGDKIEIGVS